MYKEYSSLFKVLSDPNRLKIIELLIQGETCGCTLIDSLDISQPTLSHHLKKIEEVGLADARKEGNRIKYYVKKEKIADVIDFLETLKNLKLESCEVN